MNKRVILLIIILLIPTVNALDVSIENNVLIVNGGEYEYTCFKCWKFQY